ncbi:uncharacterized protein CIMG_13056 [Coccidioides immitis RS]|uniref:Uncharacterized protein n=1 Tax=Coccidioides immitis (strain RS) TaxID=246410 RepID=J3K832_COCIM|nr:uncharacterized protein CIMG_13056 [Coccidioides immitis RS]EAS30928.3 hypothetical protein CIMG_13056 [Coccidioides immitis RS]
MNIEYGVKFLPWRKQATAIHPHNLLIYYGVLRTEYTTGGWNQTDIRFPLL